MAVWRGALETYIIRIYHREPGALSEIAGTVEEPGCLEIKSFVGIDELLSIFIEASNARMSVSSACCWKQVERWI
jgi:hypothetical protein